MYNKKTTLRSWVIWGLGALFFFLQYFPRVVPSIIASDLMQTFNVTAFALGSLSAYYLYAYVFMQLPVGLIYDRMGVKKIIAVAALIAGVGCVLFGIADNIIMARWARFMTGFAGAFGFIGAMKLANIYFPPSYYGLLAGLTQGMGMLGAALGQGPTAYLVSIMGWRSVMVLFGILLSGIAFLLVIFVKQPPKSATTASIGFVQSLLIVVKNPQSWINAGYLAFTLAPILAFAELWGVDFLQVAYNLSHNMAAFAVGVVFIGWAVGGPVMGKISDRMGKRKSPMFFSSILGLILLLVVLYCTSMPIQWLFILLFLFGFSNTGVGVSYAVAIEINDKRVGGTSIAFANLASILSGTLYQPIIGWFLDANWDGVSHNGIPVYALASYQNALLILPIGLFLGALFVFFLKETHCRDRS